MHITPIKSDELKRLARRPIFSALKNKKLGNLGLRMRDWEDALGDYLNEEKRVDEWMGGLMSKAGFKELRVWQNGKDLAGYIYQSKQ